MKRDAPRDRAYALVVLRLVGACHAEQRGEALHYGLYAP